MKLDGVPSRTIWLERDGWSVGIIDQTALPHKIVRLTLKTVEDAAHAIKSMQVRGAPLIGVTAAYGVALAMRADASDAASITRSGFSANNGRRPSICAGRSRICARRLRRFRPNARAAAAYERAAKLAEDDVETCRQHRRQRASR